MTTDQVFRDDEVSINGVRFRLYGGSRPPIVQEFQAGVQPGKVAFGDFNLDTHPFVSTWLAVNDQRGGIGIDRMDVSKDLDRCWTSLCNLRYRGHLVLPEQVNTLTNGGFGVPPAAKEIGYGRMTAELISAGTTYVSFENSAGTSVILGIAGTNLGELDNLPDEATDVISGIVNGTETLMVASGGDIDWSTNGTTYSRDTVNVHYLAVHNNLIWGINRTTGQLYYASLLSSGTTVFATDAVLQLPAEACTGLLEGNDAVGERVLYAITNRGLWVHDSANGRFLPTQLKFPVDTNSGVGYCEWRGSIYVSAGGYRIYKYTPGQPAIITVVGPDRDDGMDTTYNGVIVGLTGSLNELMATAVWPTGGTSKYVTMLGWDERGWRIIRAHDVGTDGYTTTKVTFPFASERSARLYWVFGGLLSGTRTASIKYIDLDIGITNPTQVETQKYMTGDHLHETPWFDAGSSHLNKTALRAHLDSAHPVAAATVTLDYALDYVENYTNLVTAKATTGDSHYSFGSGSGTVFRAIKFRTSMTNNVSTSSPDVITLALEFIRTLEDLRGFTLQLDLRDPTNGRPSVALVSAFDTIVNTRTLMAFGYRNETSRKVMYRTHTGLDLPGLSYNSVKLITLVEVIP